MIEEKVILLVEDNPDDEELTVLGFRQNRIHNEIVVAHDGVEALEYLFCEGKYKDRSLEKHPQVVVLDLKLPRLNGLEVLRRIRENESTKMLPVVVLTSSNEERDIIESYRSGVNAYVQKPVDFKQFVEAVKHLAVFWLKLNLFPLATSEACA